ncbi:MAG: transcriptional regulator [Nitrospirae bacterium]|nr:transcriptional regulator [Nitrospirota bacterium]
MEVILEENPTRRQILSLLKKKGALSIDELSRAINITPMGIRQHLISLEKRGFVGYITKKHGIGRPGFLYQLTEKADDLFPRAYFNFAQGLLNDIEKHDGREKVDKLFQWRMRRLLKSKEALLVGMPLSERVNTLVGLLNEEGYFTELEKLPDSFRIVQHNCPIYKLAQNYQEACTYEIYLYRELLRANVDRTACMGSGDTACEYRVRP